MTKAWELAQSKRWDKKAKGYELVIVDAPASGHGLGMLSTPRTFADIARVGPIAGQATRVREFLEDSRRSGYLAVALPGEMPVSETLQLEGQLRKELGRRVEKIVVNGVLSRRFSGAEIEQVGSMDGALPTAVERAVRAQAARVRTQQGQLQRLRRHTKADVVTLPFVFSEHLGLEDVRAMGEELARRV
jgi:anion-transporting  ArsA/GET3 family ATPase